MLCTKTHLSPSNKDRRAHDMPNLRAIRRLTGALCRPNSWTLPLSRPLAVSRSNEAEVVPDPWSCVACDKDKDGPRPRPRLD